MTNIQIKMDNIEIISIEEHRLWTARKKELIKHASIEVKQQYFPKNIIEWDKKGKEIEEKYRNAIMKENEKRRQQESEDYTNPIKI
jgi:hypothetical protein